MKLFWKVKRETIKRRAGGDYRMRVILTVAEVLQLASRLFRPRLLIHNAVEQFQFPLQIGRLSVFRICQSQYATQ